MHKSKKLKLKILFIVLAYVISLLSNLHVVNATEVKEVLESKNVKVRRIFTNNSNNTTRE